MVAGADHKFRCRLRLQIVLDEILALLQMIEAFSQATLGRVGNSRRVSFQVMNGKENASTTTLKNQRFNINDTIANGIENVRNGK